MYKIKYENRRASRDLACVDYRSSEYVFLTRCRFAGLKIEEMRRRRESDDGGMNIGDGGVAASGDLETTDPRFVMYMALRQVLEPENWNPRYSSVLRVKQWFTSTTEIQIP